MVRVLDIVCIFSFQEFDDLLPLNTRENPFRKHTREQIKELCKEMSASLISRDANFLSLCKQHLRTESLFCKFIGFTIDIFLLV